MNTKLKCAAHCNISDTCNISAITKGLKAEETFSYSLWLIAACHVRGIRLFNHASLEKKKMFRTTGSTCSRLKIFASKCQNDFPQMLFDSVRSLVMCNLFSHALLWSAWPPARSGFLLTLNMSEAEVRLRTMTDTDSVQTRKTGHLDLGSFDDPIAVWLFLLMRWFRSGFWTRAAQIMMDLDPFHVWIQIMSLNLA